MQCHYCRCYNRKFYCKSCLTEKLLDHSKEVARTRKERDHAIHQAQIHLEATEASHRLLVEKTKRTMHLDQLANAQHQTTKDTAQLRMDIDQLKQNLAERRQRLHQSKQVQAQACSELEDVDDIRLKAWQRTHKLTTRTRQILVREVASLFNVKAGVVEENTDDDLHSCSPPPLSSHPPLQPAPSDSTTLATSDTIDPVENMPFSRSTTLTQQVRRPVVEDLYICGVSLPTRLIDISIYPKEELNSTIGYICQMMELIIQYLGIKLPFTLFRKDTHQYIRSPPHSKFYPNQSKMPLFMDDDHNFRRFLTAIAMLNYDVAYLCHTQGIDIPLSQVANTLQNLMTCCQAPNLGIRSHATIYQGLMEMQYSVDFQQVLRQTGLRYRCGAPTMTQDLDDKYFKVRHSAFLGDQYQGDEEDDEEDDEDVDTTKEKCDESSFHTADPNDRDSQQDIEQKSTDSSGQENWNLVDVMPAFATARSGPSESILQLGATLMPGVMGMMESFGRSHHNSSIHKQDSPRSRRQ